MNSRKKNRYFVASIFFHHLIDGREVNILYLEGVSSEKDKDRILNVIAHELAHQWFGNLVTMHWWTDLWLNEGKS